LLVFFWGLNNAFQSMGAPPTTRGLVFWYAPKERATIWTLYASAHTCGTFLIGLIVAFLIKYFDWRAAFYVPGMIGIATSFFIFYTLADRPTSLGLPPVEEYKNDVQPVVKESGLTHWQTLKKYVFFNSAVWYLAFAYIFVYYVRFATLDWGAKFMFDVKGIEKVSVAVLWSMMPLLGMPGGIVAGYLSDRFFNGRCTPMNLIYLTILGVITVCFYKFSSAGNLVLTGAMLAAIGFFVDGPQNLVGGVQVSRVTPQESVSTAYGLVGMFGYFGATLSGIGTAFIVNKWNWGALYYGCAISCILAMFFVALTWKKESAGAEQEKLRKLSEKKI
jgi:sugar phosphate permease